MTGVVDQPRLEPGLSTSSAGDGSRRRVAVVGSTGSIGTQALDVLRSAPDRFTVSALGAARSVDLLAAQAEEFRPEVVAIADSSLAPETRGVAACRHRAAGRARGACRRSRRPVTWC